MKFEKVRQIERRQFFNVKNVNKKKSWNEKRTTKLGFLQPWIIKIKIVQPDLRTQHWFMGMNHTD